MLQENMYNKKYLLCYVCLIFLIGISSVNASTINIGDYVVSAEQGKCFNIPTSCDNCTEINITILYPNGTEVVTDGIMTTLDGYHYNYTFCDTNETGRYWFYYHYLDDGIYPTTDGDWLIINPSGYTLRDAQAIIYLGVLGMILILLLISLFGTFTVEQYIGKFALYLTTHVLFIIWTFSVWQVTNAFLIGFIGLAGIFKILFYVSIISFFPMIILSIAWIVYIHTFNEHFQKLIDKGNDTETAFRLAEKKRGGWFNGK